jgi:hypothetical protein
MPLRDDNPSEVDLLGFEDVADVVESIVTRADMDPVTVGVNAPWVAGSPPSCNSSNGASTDAKTSSAFL